MVQLKATNLKNGFSPWMIFMAMKNSQEKIQKEFY